MKYHNTRWHSATRDHTEGSPCFAKAYMQGALPGRRDDLFEGSGAWTKVRLKVSEKLPRSPSMQTRKAVGRPQAYPICGEGALGNSQPESDIHWQGRQVSKSAESIARVETPACCSPPATSHYPKSKSKTGLPPVERIVRRRRFQLTVNFLRAHNSVSP